MIRTDRLLLRPATPDLVRAALGGSECLALALGATVPASWPPEYLDPAAFQYTLDRLLEAPEHQAWWMYFVLLHQDRVAPILIGSGGYKGPPDPSGTVEIGYGIVADHRRLGYATEVARALIAQAWSHPVTTRIIAETLPELTGSIGVLRRCGFELIGEGSEPGVIRFELSARPSS